MIKNYFFKQHPENPLTSLEKHLDIRRIDFARAKNSTEDYSVQIPKFEDFKNSDNFRKAIEEQCHKFSIFPYFKPLQSLCKKLAKKKRNEHPIYAKLKELSDDTINTLINTLSDEDHTPQLECNLKKYCRHNVDPNRLLIAEYFFDNFPESPVKSLNDTLDRIKFDVFPFEEFDFYQSPKSTRRRIEAKDFDIRYEQYISGVDKVKKLLKQADFGMLNHFANRLDISTTNKRLDRIRHEIMNYYETKHCYSVYQNAISEYLRPIPSSLDSMDFS